jgi:hypothetical protein
MFLLADQRGSKLFCEKAPTPLLSGRKSSNGSTGSCARGQPMGEGWSCRRISSAPCKRVSRMLTISFVRHGVGAFSLLGGQPSFVFSTACGG